MTIYFSRLKVPYPKTYGYPADWEGCWKVYTIWLRETSDSCTTRADVHNLQSQKDKMDARFTFVTLLNRALTGRNFADLYDIKRCHVAHTFSYTADDGKSKEVRIFRIWGAGKIRTYFIYIEGRRIALLKTLAKRSSTLTGGQTKELEEIAKLVSSSLNQSTFQGREKP